MPLSCVIDENTIQYLKSRLIQLENNKKQVIESLLSTSRSIEELRDKLGSSKKLKSHVIISMIEELENDLTISSYTIEETRNKEKQIDKLNKDLATAVQQNLFEEELNCQKDKRRQLKNRLVELRKEITEVDSAICVAWVIIFCKRISIQITPDEVHSEMIPMTEKQFNQLHKRPIMARLESSLCIKCTYCRILSACLVYGRLSSIPSAIEIINDCFSWDSVVLPYNSLEVSILLYRNCKYLHEIEKESVTIFYIRNDSQHISFQGGAKAREKALILYKSLFENRVSVPLSDAVFTRLASKNKPYFSTIKEQSNCYFYLDFKKHILYYYGNSLEIKHTRDYLQSYLQSLEVSEKRIELTDAHQISFLIGDKGSTIRTLTDCNYSFSKKNESPFILLQGCSLEIEKGEKWLTTKLEEYRSKNRVIELPNLGIPLLLNAQGKELRRIEQGSNTKLIVLKETNSIIIRGKSAVCVENAITALSTLFSSITSKEYEIANEIRSEMIGRKGEHINSLRRKYQVSVQLTETVLKCEGMLENIQACDAYLTSWLNCHSVRQVCQSKDLIGRLIIGKQGCQVKQLEQQYHIRILQTTENGNSVLSLVGTMEDVNACFEFIDNQITAYLSTHYACQFSQLQWSWCPQLSRVAIGEYQKQHPNSTIIVSASTGSIRCEGPPEEIHSLKVLFDSIEEKEKGKNVFRINVPKEHIGLVIGKNGSTIKELENQFQVSMKLQKEDGIFTLWCTEEEWKAVNQSIQTLIEEKAIITRTIAISASQRSQLMVDKCRPVHSIQSTHSVQIKLPSPNDSTLSVQGNQLNCSKAIASLQTIFSGIYCYHYHYSSHCMNQLLANPSFHIERVSLANHCNIQYDTAGNIDIRGNYDSIHKAHAQIFSQLTVTFPSQFKQYPLTNGSAYYLMNNKCSIGMDTPTCVVNVEPSEKMVYVYGNPSFVEKKSIELQFALAVLASENLIIQVEREFLPIIIGSKGVSIREIEVASHCQLTVLKNSNEIYLHGTKEEVEIARCSIEKRVMEYRELNCCIQTTASLFSLFMSEYGNLLKDWEEENACTVRVDKKVNSIMIHGKNKENVENMKFVIENMLESVELDEEKNDLIQDDPIAEEEVSDAVQQINMLLGIV